MKKSKRKKKPETLADRLGEENARRFIHMIAEGRSYSEIVKAMPRILKTRGIVAGVRRDWKEEIDRNVTALMVAAPVKRAGRSRPFRDRGVKKCAARVTAIEEDEKSAAALAYDEWVKTREVNPHVAAAIAINKLRVTSSRRPTNAEHVGERMEELGGVKAFLLTIAWFREKYADPETRATYIAAVVRKYSR